MLNHLASAVNFNGESADAYYHLAVALLQAGPTRDLEGCIRAARHAVELQSNEIRYWHLLGLALSADGQHTQAREVLEIGESLQTEDDDDNPAEETSATPASEAKESTDEEVETLILPSTKQVPSPTSMLLPIPCHPHPSKEDMFEHGLQLRITLLSLIELMDGAEIASVKWVEVFAWFAERGGWARPVIEREY